MTDDVVTILRSAADVLADLPLTPAPGAWAMDAACSAFPEAFSPDGKPDPDELDVAVRVCRHCPVRSECADYAAQWATYGVWAGRWYDTARRHAKAV